MLDSAESFSIPQKISRNPDPSETWVGLGWELGTQEMSNPTKINLWPNPAQVNPKLEKMCIVLEQEKQRNRD